MSAGAHQDHREVIRRAILDDPELVSAVFGGSRPRADLPWIKVTVRPVLLGGERNLQFQYFDELRSVTRNYAGAEAAARLDELIALPFRHAWVRSRDRGIQLQITKRGKALLRRHASPSGAAEPDLAHDRRKRRMVDPARGAGYLNALGITTHDGRIKPTMQAKFRQIDEFLRIVVPRILPPDGGKDAPRVVDFGCGNAYLTFALYEQLARLTGRTPSVTGVDTDALAVERHRATSRSLGWEGLSFAVDTIVAYEADPPPAVVVALHACDTATDEALAKAVRWEAGYLFCAPCCHHHLQLQLDPRTALPDLAPILRFGLMKERLGDVLTDTLRALILGTAGYRVDIVQFVSPEHTTRNLMLVARRREDVDRAAAAAQYRGLCAAFGVVPHLASLLADRIEPLAAPHGAG